MVNLKKKRWDVFGIGLRHAVPKPKQPDIVSGADHPLLFARDPRDREAMVTSAILPPKRGRVRFKGSLWPARCLENAILEAGARVRVVGVSNITLVVEGID